MWEDVATLLSDPTASYDSYGNETLTYTRREVYVQTRGVYQSEFYNAAQLGIQPSIVLIMSNRTDYEGEKLVEFHGRTYDIVRADWSNGKDSISLTLAERIGNDGR